MPLSPAQPPPTNTPPQLRKYLNNSRQETNQLIENLRRMKVTCSESDNNHTRHLTPQRQLQLPEASQHCFMKRNVPNCNPALTTSYRYRMSQYMIASDTYMYRAHTVSRVSTPWSQIFRTILDRRTERWSQKSPRK